jgi:hypothetical protein
LCKNWSIVAWFLRKRSFFSPKFAEIGDHNIDPWPTFADKCTLNIFLSGKIVHMRHILGFSRTNAKLQLRPGMLEIKVQLRLNFVKLFWP